MGNLLRALRHCTHPPSDRCGFSPATGAPVHVGETVTNYCTAEASIETCWGAGSVAKCATIERDGQQAHSKCSGSRVWHGVSERSQLCR